MVQTATTNDPMYFVAAHEAGHAVASMLAHRDLGRSSAPFRRILIRRDFSSPYTDRKGREINCSGLCEGIALHSAGPNPGIPYFEILAEMKWEMIVSFAGPFAEAFSKNFRSRRDKHWNVLLSCGARKDYATAEAVLADYKKVSRRRYGLLHFEELAWDLVIANQPAISALSSKLLKHETLDYKEAHRIAAPLLNPAMPVLARARRPDTKQQIRGRSANMPYAPTQR
jgi:hypothetical protein